jgi:hypothetical protein
MNANPLPLPLEVAKPMVLAGALDTQVRTMFAHGYDATTQLGGCGAGVSTSTTSDVECNVTSESSPSGLLSVDTQTDFAMDYTTDDEYADQIDF